MARRDVSALFSSMIVLEGFLPGSPEPQSLPVEQILRYGEGDPRALGRKCRVSHDVALQRLHECDTRILAATAAIRSPLIISFRLERNAETLDACRITGSIKPHSYNADARVIPPRHQSREEVERAIRATNRSRIQDAFDLLGLPGSGSINIPQALQFKSAHQIVLKKSRRPIAPCQACDDFALPD